LEQLERRQTPQTLAWLRDLYKRGLLDLEPPYQRRSVWNQAFKEYFIETILLNHPAPPIFLHESITPDGVASYSVVDGKQRLTTVFEFADDLFPVGDESILERLQGKFFSQLDESTRSAFWTYKFAVEFLPVTDEAYLTDVFDRLNRNVARLTRQELRRAKFSGLFATAAEEMTDYILMTLPQGFPRIAAASRRQMKDVELAAQLLLLAEEGPSSFSQDQLDEAYSDRDIEWEDRQRVERRYRRATSDIAELVTVEGCPLYQTRLRNQADFYSLFGAVLELRGEKSLPDSASGAAAISDFIAVVIDERARAEDEDATAYYEAARSASNDLRQRRTRIRILENVLHAAAE
jgi:Protein of unknown function DUF262